ncbi:MAG: hypothetical protein C5B59_02570 [Bacteroidetes bacterium]|nr:MAG: hypothetical protein C5B59_02570 [Bacteroidota bacterium]
METRRNWMEDPEYVHGWTLKRWFFTPQKILWRYKKPAPVKVRLFILAHPKFRQVQVTTSMQDFV